MTMLVTICGPMRHGSFHVHAAECAKLSRSSEPEYRRGWTINVESKRDTTIGDDLSEARKDLYFFPCCDDLKES